MDFRCIWENWFCKFFVLWISIFDFLCNRNVFFFFLSNCCLVRNLNSDVTEDKSFNDIKIFWGPRHTCLELHHLRTVQPRTWWHNHEVISKFFSGFILYFCRKMNKISDSEVLQKCFRRKLAAILLSPAIWISKKESVSIWFRLDQEVSSCVESLTYSPFVVSPYVKARRSSHTQK